jgi:hypothetical protein
MMIEAKVNTTKVLNMLPIWAVTEIQCYSCHATWNHTHTIYDTQCECPSCMKYNKVKFIESKLN